jgi:4-amino-4-deoxy-L-arabinose transferase-like glycosyltransferase
MAEPISRDAVAETTLEPALDTEPEAARYPGWEATPRGVTHRLRSFLLSRPFVPLVILLAISSRIAWIYRYPALPVSDFNWYYTVGGSIAHGQGFAFGGLPTATRPPGYPLLLAASNVLFGDSFLMARIFTAAFGIGTLVLAYLIARRLFSSELTGRLTLLILAFFPNQIAYSGLFASELPFAFFTLLGAWLLLTRPRSVWTFIGAGASFGAALLIRPVGVVLPVLFLIAFVWRGAGFKAFLRGSVVVYLMMALLLIPWLGRNQQAFGHATYSLEGGEALLEGTFPATDMRKVIAQSSALVPQTGDPIIDDQRRQSFALHYMRTHPGAMLKLVPDKVKNFNWSDADAVAWTIEGLSKPEKSLYTFITIANRYYIVVMGLSVAGLLLGLAIYRRWKRFSLVPFAVWFVTMAFYLPFAGSGRYHAPLVPWTSMYAAALLAFILGDRRRPASRGAARPSV